MSRASALAPQAGGIGERFSLGYSVHGLLTIDQAIWRKDRLGEGRAGVIRGGCAGGQGPAVGVQAGTVVEVGADQPHAVLW